MLQPKFFFSSAQAALFKNDFQRLVDLINKNPSDINQQSNIDGSTILHCAIFHTANPYYLETINILLDNGADPTICNKIGQNCFVYAKSVGVSDENIEKIKAHYALIRQIADDKIFAKPDPRPRSNTGDKLQQKEEAMDHSQ